MLPYACEWILTLERQQRTRPGQQHPGADASQAPHQLPRRQQAAHAGHKHSARTRGGCRLGPRAPPAAPDDEKSPPERIFNPKMCPSGAQSRLRLDPKRSVGIQRWRPMRRQAAVRAQRAPPGAGARCLGREVGWIGAAWRGAAAIAGSGAAARRRARTDAAVRPAPVPAAPPLRLRRPPRRWVPLVAPRRGAAGSYRREARVTDLSRGGGHGARREGGP